MIQGFLKFLLIWGVRECLSKFEAVSYEPRISKTNHHVAFKGSLAPRSSHLHPWGSLFGNSTLGKLETWEALYGIFWDFSKNSQTKKTHSWGTLLFFADVFNMFRENAQVQYVFTILGSCVDQSDDFFHQQKSSYRSRTPWNFLTVRVKQDSPLKHATHCPIASMILSL